MKKNILIYGTILLLACALTGTITYILMDEKDKEPEIKDPASNNEDKSNNNVENNKTETIKLSEKELAEYLTYIPQDSEYADRNVYKNTKITIETVDKTLLRDYILNISSNCLESNSCPFDISKSITITGNFDFTELSQNTNSYIPLTYVNKQLTKMYNYELTNLKNATSIEDEFTAGGMGYIYQNGNFILTGGGSTGGSHISLLENYNATKEELVIYEYAALYSSEFNGEENKYDINDYYNKYSVQVTGKNFNFKQYLKEHKDKFTKYKHTYKKNDTGYYWYSTEVAR